jgi:hypothetical protein
MCSRAETASGDVWRENSTRDAPPDLLEWVGAERGALRSVSPHLPLPPYVTLSASYGDRLEVSFTSSYAERHPQVHSPALPFVQINEEGPPSSGPSPCAELSSTP